MPVRDAEGHLAESVSHVLSQAYPGEIELLLAVGPSKDQTEQVAKELAAGDPRIKVVANPTGGIPSALNAAVRASRHPVIVRVDARSRLPAGYIAAAVRTLRETGAVNVGGVMAAEGVTPFQRAVAWAMTSPAGVGSARFHTGGKAGPSDSVYLGTFRREAIENVGGYDEQYLRGEDWEMNHRIREAGGLIWFQPELRVTYRPRTNVRQLAAQYFLYGRWRRAVARRHPGTMNLRYLAPPATLVVLVIGTLAGLAGVASLADRTGTWWQWLLTAGLVVPLGYLIGVLVVTARAGTDGRLSGRAVACLPIVLATMHLCWGAGFLTSSRRLVKAPRSGDQGPYGSSGPAGPISASNSSAIRRSPG
ncbi:MAG TPA: glycosyltransferase family 2 protein [Streptosporangiaceae bacterium]|nr:glycosyltransferase family 2 protein [Streptosporangiaceae bacterium]